LPELQTTTTIKSHVNLKKSTLNLTRADGEQNKYGLEFQFDCDKDCYVSVYFLAKESYENNSIMLASIPPPLFFPLSPLLRFLNLSFHLASPQYMKEPTCPQAIIPRKSTTVSPSPTNISWTFQSLSFFKTFFFLFSFF